MRRKDVNRCRREWQALGLADPSEVAEWADKWGAPLLDEVKRLRQELKRSNKKRRRVYGKLELERTDLDELIDEIEELHDELPSDPVSDVGALLLRCRLEEILEPFMEDHDGEDDDGSR